MSLHEGYFPSMHELKLDEAEAAPFATEADKQRKVQHNQHVLFGRDVMSPTMGHDADDLSDALRHRYHATQMQLQQATKQLAQTKTALQASVAGHQPVDASAMTDYVAAKAALSNKQHQLAEINALIERGFGFEDVNDDNYHRVLYNPNTFSFWFPRLLSAAKHQSFFKIPATKYLTLPQSIMQYLHHDWKVETNQKSRDALNQLLFDTFKLDVNQEYFFKTGLFSGKFEFQNAHIDDPKAIGDYLHVVSNEAQMIGAATSNDMVVREWIPDPENRPTIYDGMPLRTEFRAFIDADLQRVIDVVPYWNNQKVEDTLNMMHHTHIGNQNMAQDAKAYAAAKPMLDRDFAENKALVMTKLQAVVDKLALSGCWSLDVMKSGDDFYLIDMATMATSALTDTVDEQARLNELALRQAKQLPAVMPFETNWKFAADPKTIMDAYDKLPQPADLEKLTD